MSSHNNNPYGDYSNTRRRSFPLSPGSHQRSAELPALSDPANVNQELAHPYSLAYRDASMNYYPTGTSNPGHYGADHQYQGGRGPAYHQHAQGTMHTSYASGQNTRDVYLQPGADLPWTQEHPIRADFHRSDSWPQYQHHVSPSAPQMPLHGSTSMSQIQVANNSRGRREVMVPQRSYVPHHRQNYLDQFIAENPIMFPSRSGGEGITFSDVLSENFDHLLGRDDPMFANYMGPAISLRLEWLGYKSWTKQIKTKDWRREPKPITKVKLAIEVVKKVQNFIQDSINEPITPGLERWRVGPGFIEAKDLVLFRLVHVSKGSWQAEFRTFE